MFGRILFPLDFSDRSLRLFDRLLEMPDLTSMEMILMFVSSPDERLTEDRRSTLDEMHRRLDEVGITSREIVVFGDPAAEILNAAGRENADLIAMASSGKGRAWELFIGSTSWKVLRSTDRPVLIGGSMDVSDRPILSNALVALDLSSCREIVDRVLPALIGLGLQKAVLLHVIPSTHYSLDDDDRFTQVADMLDDIRLRLSSGGCDLSYHVHFGTVSYNILEAARELDSSIMVMGIRRRSLLREVALGGNSEDVIRRSPIPLLVVPCER
ncbi:MAG: universal stress protein [Methanomassiliicoccaceae archaeon]|jgi:nucleotide-binding universal stress UspA family protein|nr:universal stress protein [Euryarchaeota archaeon]HOB37946.1 universal stress protein [Methanomassiliicoccaceae archaeon]HOL07953.1 universal stress protein [Methanomassiliicoccaceae archaeon]HQA21122.1 universal stress protein [Methanomassiliicoccaceae archaeon]HQD87658.1 universal stress protein [Methanomassiliicoccaceae archaeon]